MKPYQQTIENVVNTLKTNTLTGLSQVTADERLKTYGFNALPEQKPESLFFVFLRQFKDPLIYLLLISATIIFFLGEHIDAFVISGVLFFNAILGTIQEGRARSILNSLKHYVKTDAIVIRDGNKHIIPSEQLVPGDLIVLETGEKVPADARIIQAQNLTIDESMLTGETMGIEKNSEALRTEVPIHDQKNMVFKGTNILTGAGVALVTETGNKTAVGKLNVTISQIQTDMPLKRELDRLSHWILIAIFCICLGLLALGIMQGKSLTQLLVILTALFICVIPEGLPVVFTLALVTGAQRLAKKNVLVKRMQAVEGLARTDVIVVDKTGTLTRNEMVISRIITAEKEYSVSGKGYKAEGDIYDNDTKVTVVDTPNLTLMTTAAALLNRAEIEYNPTLDTFAIKGDPTEVALDVFVQKSGIIKKNLEKEYQSIIELPFNSTLKYQAGAYVHNNNGIIFIIGAPEVIMQHDNNKKDLEEKLKHLLQQGLRMVGVAKTIFSPIDMPQTQEQQEAFIRKTINTHSDVIGFFGIEDTIRTEVHESIATARQAGIQVVMATGDHKETALFIAQKTGIFRKGDFALDGSKLVNLTQEEFLKQLPRITVFSRVTPEDKLRIIQAYHQIGKIITMTGDGVNDAPSLAAADLGIAMGKIGTEVAKEASDMILLDDSFASIIDAIKEGKHIFYALKRAILYFFTTNIGEVLVILMALILKYPVPLLAPQILWINLITDGFLDVALTMEKQEKGILTADYVHNKKQLVDFSIFFKMLYLSIPMSAVSFCIFSYYLKDGLIFARTMGMVTLVMFQWFHAWNCRSTRLSIFQSGVFSNIWLIAATIFVFGLQLLILYVPFLQKIFRTMPLSLENWGLIIAVSFPIILLEEFRKFLARRWFS